MSFASHRTLSALRASSLLTSKRAVVPQQIVRNATKTASTPGIAGLGGKIGKGGATAAPLSKKPSILPVEEDVERLVTHVCGTNILKEGGEDVKLKPDSEYPDWLWTIRTGPPPHYSELTPDDKEYWRQVKKIYFKEQKRIKDRLRF